MIFKNKTLKKNLNILSFIKNFFAILFSIQILIIFILIVWYSTSPIKYIYSPERIIKILSSKTKNSIGFDGANINKYLKVYSLSGYYSLFKPKVDKIDLRISQKNLIELEFQRENRSKIFGTNQEIKKKLNRFVNGSLSFEGKKLPIKMRVKGDRKIHYDNKLTTSYKIDMRGSNRLFGFEEFSVQKPIIRNYAYEYIFHKLHSELGNISLDYKVINLSINGTDYGIYSVEEGFSKELIERHSKRNGPIFGIDDELSDIYPNVVYDSYSEEYWANNNPSLLNTGYGILNLIKENSSTVSNYIDWEAWGKFFAVTDMVEAYHGSLAKSVRIYYNPVSGKIEPISFDGHHGTADFSNFIILDFLKDNPSCSWICEEKEWFLRFLIDENNNPREEFLKYYIKYLKKISSPEFINYFYKKYSSDINNLNKHFYSDFSKYDNIFWKGLFPYIYKDNYLYERSKKINSKLNSTNLSEYIFSKKNNKIKIKVISKNYPVNLKSNCELDKNKKIQTWLTESQDFAWSKYCDSLIISSIAGASRLVNLSENPVLNTLLPQDLSKLPSVVDHLEGELIDDFFLISNINNEISLDLQVPKGITLKLLKNQKLIFKNGSSLVLFGNLFVDAGINNEAYFQGEAPLYGSIINFNNNIHLSNLVISDLTMPKFDGYDFYAGFNAYKSKIKIDNVVFSESKSEDTLNIIDSNSLISNIKFYNTKSDALDIDGGFSKIENLYCDNIGNDCLDFSNSLIVGKNVITNNVMDKAISIGERSKVTMSNINIKNSEIGLAVKDNSDAELVHLNITNSKLPIAVFVKKNEYGPAKLQINNFNLKESEELYLVDDVSNLIIDGENFRGYETGEKIESYLYGNEYGKATIR